MGDLVLTPPEPIAITPFDLLQQAIKQGVPVDTLERLQAMHDRWVANQARKAFEDAMLEFKQNPPTIKRTKDGPALGNGNKPSYKYAPLDEVCAAITPALEKVGITHKWETAYEGEWLLVSCVLKHHLGHSERTTLRGCDDKGPGRNAIQAQMSTLTYLERHTLLAACGIAVKGTDNDGAGANPNALTPERVQERVKDIELAESRADLQERFTNAYKEAAQHNDKAAQNAYITAKDSRKKVLHA